MEFYKDYFKGKYTAERREYGAGQMVTATNPDKSVTVAICYEGPTGDQVWYKWELPAQKVDKFLDDVIKKGYHLVG